VVSSGKKKQRLREDTTVIYKFIRGADSKGGGRRGEELFEQK